MARGPRPGPGADTAQANPLAAVFGEQAAEFIGQAGLGGGAGGGGLMALIMGRSARAPGDTLQVVVTDVKGDTVRSFYTSASPSALRWITWDMRRDRAAQLSPSALRDSIVGARRMAFLRDSLRTAAGDTSATPRPGGGLAALMRDPEPREPGSFNNPLQRVMGGGRGGGAGGLLGGAGAMAEPGTYLITIRLNGREYKQVARIERPVQTSALSGQWQ
jgi:hypothetical protein